MFSDFYCIYFLSVRADSESNNIHDLILVQHQQMKRRQA